jgi:hypothetical protein
MVRRTATSHLFVWRLTRALSTFTLLLTGLQVLPVELPGLASSAGAAVTGDPTRALEESAGGIGCISDKTCLVVGSAPGGGPQDSAAEVVEVVNGAPSAVHKVAAVSGFDAISCAGPVGCEATGFAKTGDLAIAISASGVAGHKVTLPSLFTAISCYGPSLACEAVATEGKTVAVVSVNAGSVGSVHTLSLTAPSGALDSGVVSCWSATTCEVGLTYSTGKAFLGFVFPVSAGVPGPVTKVSSTYGITGIACPAVGQCTVTGSSVSGTAMVAPLSGSHLGAVHTVAQATELNDVSCSSFALCTAVGSTQGAKNPQGKSIVVRVSRGVPGAGSVISAAAVLSRVASAPGGFYEAVGQVSFGLNSGNDVVVSS